MGAVVGGGAEAGTWGRQGKNAMSYQASTARPSLGAGWQENAVSAIRENPEYFVWWYTAKSPALVGACAWAAYLLGKQAGRKEGEK